MHWKTDKIHTSFMLELTVRMLLLLLFSFVCKKWAEKNDHVFWRSKNQPYKRSIVLKNKQKCNLSTSKKKNVK